MSSWSLGCMWRRGGAPIGAAHFSRLACGARHKKASRFGVIVVGIGLVVFDAICAGTSIEACAAPPLIEACAAPPPIGASIVCLREGLASGVCRS